MAKQSYKASMKEIRAMDLGKILNMSLSEKQRILGGISRQAANVVDRMERSGVKSFELGQLRRSLDVQKQKYGIKGFSLPKTGWKFVYKIEKGPKKGLLQTQSKSLNALVNKRLEIMLTFLQSKGATVTGAKKQLEDFRKEHNWGDATFDDVDDYWDRYEEFREMAKTAGEGNKSPDIQKKLADWEQDDLTEEEKEYLMKEYGEDILVKGRERERLDYLVERWKKGHAKPSSAYKARGRKVNL